MSGFVQPFRGLLDPETWEVPRPIQVDQSIAVRFGVVVQRVEFVRMAETWKVFVSVRGIVLDRDSGKSIPLRFDGEDFDPKLEDGTQRIRDTLRAFMEHEIDESIRKGGALVFNAHPEDTHPKR